MVMRALSAAEFEHFNALWAAGNSASSIASTFGVKVHDIYNFARKLGLKRDAINSEVQKKQREEKSRNIYNNWHRRHKRKPPIGIVTSAAGANNYSTGTVRNVDAETRRLIDEAILAGRVKRLSPLTELEDARRVFQLPNQENALIQQPVGDEDAK